MRKKEGGENANQEFCMSRKREETSTTRRKGGSYIWGEKKGAKRKVTLPAIGASTGKNVGDGASKEKERKTREVPSWKRKKNKVKERSEGESREPPRRGRRKRKKHPPRRGKRRKRGKYASSGLRKGKGGKKRKGFPVSPRGRRSAFVAGKKLGPRKLTGS